jgi:hypothetical protein
VPAPPHPRQTASTTIAQSRPPAGKDPDVAAEIQRLRNSKSLIEEEDTSAQPATYTVVDVRKTPEATPGVVAVEVKLAHVMN